jgi:DNA-binding transcriptional ArsR family regulator
MRLRLAGGIESDVGEFQRALANSQLSEAVAMYHGPLLDGFQLERAAEFERWLDTWRSHFARACIDAIERLADVAERSERWHDAAIWWARAEEIDPFSTSVVMHRMRALERGGDLANAMRNGEAHRRRLVEELEVEPDQALIARLARLRGGGVPAMPVTLSAIRRVGPRHAEPSLDRVFQALANPTQRAVVERLRVSPASLGELAGIIKVPLSAMRGHLQELQSSAVVIPGRAGGTRTFRLNRAVLRTAERWLAVARSHVGPHGIHG